MITIDRLRYMLSYNPYSGLWTRRVARAGTKVGDIARHIDACGYVQVHIDGKYYRSTHLAFFYMTGKWPPDQVDHKDHKRSNDRWDNLRLATRSENKGNSTTYRNNVLQVKGVTENKRMVSRPFRARIFINGKSKHLGYFATKEEANTAYAKAAELNFGEFAWAA